MGFDLSPIMSVTLQNAVLSATSNLLAQALTSYRNDTPFIVDWVPVVQFIIFTFVNTPPNYLWQDFLESTFPGYHAAPTDAAVEKAARSDDKALDKAAGPELVEPKLNIRNTLIKTVLDQTVGAAINTLLFSVFMNSLKAAMARPSGLDAPGQSAAFLFSRAAIDYSRVDWAQIAERTKAEFFPLIAAGWRLWPAVSLINFACIKTVEGRNLLGGLAGVGWGIYVSLFAAE
ncbi:hypothetical protein B0T11DRAFT_284115 [Plectosphaerella cucumerina]|uniref:Uncharacterized protein n=1 Tax=Plectosphaerella cucumerina TaxID=40658 RepID=A0A8K0X2B7_9PEZI|nr:hypothetical protein B0T11DRAFT_284115 [Plectosphaerella cucumerina]